MQIKLTFSPAATGIPMGAEFHVNSSLRIYNNYGPPCLENISRCVQIKCTLIQLQTRRLGNLESLKDVKNGIFLKLHLQRSCCHLATGKSFRKDFQCIPTSLHNRLRIRMNVALSSEHIHTR